MTAKHTTPKPPRVQFAQPKRSRVFTFHVVGENLSELVTSAFIPGIGMVEALPVDPDLVVTIGVSNA